VALLIALDPIIGVGEVNESDLGVVRQSARTADLRLVNGEDGVRQDRALCQPVGAGGDAHLHGRGRGGRTGTWRSPPA
jgi:hypothetical protein